MPLHCRIWFMAQIIVKLLVWLITGIITPNQPASLFTVLSRQGVGHSVLLSQEPVIVSQSFQAKNGGATDSCFALDGAHQCGILVDVMG